VKNLPPLLPPTEEPSPSSATGSEATSGAEHLDHIEIPAEAIGAGEEGAGAPGAPAAPARVTREQFAELLAAALGIAGAVTGLRSLPIADAERPAFMPAAGAVYDTVVEIPALHWLLEPGNVYVQRALVVAAFVVPKARAVADELAAVRAARAKPAGSMRTEAAERARARDQADPLGGFPPDGATA
jgi:hypothetical protein